MCAGVSQPKTGEVRYTDEAVTEALQSSRSLSEAARRIGVSRQVVARYAAENGVSLDHMISSKGRVRSLDSIFCVKAKRDSGMVRKYLRLLEPDNYSCVSCGLGPYWNGTELVLQMDHINGNACDDRRENLRWLCPNCHTQTETFTGRNARRKEPPL